MFGFPPVVDVSIDSILPNFPHSVRAHAVRGMPEMLSRVRDVLDTCWIVLIAWATSGS